MSIALYGVGLTGLLIVAYVVLIAIGKAPTPGTLIPSKQSVLRKLFGTQRKRRYFALFMILPILGLHVGTVMHPRFGERSQFLSLLAFFLYPLSLWFALKIKSILVPDRRIPVRSREYEDNTEITYLFPQTVYEQFKLINCHQLDRIWTPEHGDTRVALDVDLDTRLIMGNHRSIPDSELWGLPGDVKRLVEELAPARKRLEEYQRRTWELGQEIANERTYRREIGISQLETPEMYGEDGRLPPEWMTACERLGIEYSEDSREIRMTQTIQESTIENGREGDGDAKKKVVSVDELRGVSSSPTEAEGNGTEGGNDE